MLNTKENYCKSTDHWLHQKVGLVRSEDHTLDCKLDLGPSGGDDDDGSQGDGFPSWTRVHYVTETLSKRGQVEFGLELHKSLVKLEVYFLWSLGMECQNEQHFGMKLTR